MVDPPLALATLACAVAAAAGLLPLRATSRLIGLCVAVLLAPMLVLADYWHAEKLEPLTSRPALLVLCGLLGLAATFAGGLLLRDRLHLLPPLLIAALPFRIPVDLGGGSTNLLVPLYVAIAVGLAATLLAALRDAGDPRPSAPPRPLRLLGPLLAGVLVLYGLQSAYVEDPATAVENVAFFLVPFAALFYLLASARWDAVALRRIVWVLAIEGLFFALVAAGQYLSGELFWNDKVIEGNEAHQYFRVNSLFWDPNVLGRYLTITMLAAGGIVAFARSARERHLATALFVVLLVALTMTFSQSSMIALLAGLLVLLAARAGIAWGTVAALAVVVGLVASIVAIGGAGLSEDVSSGRAGLVDGGLEIAADNPVFGVGSGGFGDEFRARFYEGVGFAVESHTEPITVAAEQGVVGLIAYAALLLVSVGGLIVLVRPHLLAPASGQPLATVLCAAYLVMIVHSMGYAAFLTDPLTWAILALACGALAAPGVGRAAGRSESATMADPGGPATAKAT